MRPSLIFTYAYFTYYRLQALFKKLLRGVVEAQKRLCKLYEIYDARLRLF